MFQRLPAFSAPTPAIFISYRADDSKPWVLIIRDELVKAFGQEAVFFDREVLHAGQWQHQIDRALNGCRVMLVVIGPRWLNAVDECGEQRLWHPDDVHRLEIERALGRGPDVTVIPILVDKALLPRPDQLPEAIVGIASCQAREFGDSAARRRVDAGVLFDDIEHVTGLKGRRVGVAAVIARQVWSSARFLATTFVLSLAVVVVAELGLAWNLGPTEEALVVLAVLIGQAAASRMRRRPSGASQPRARARRSYKKQ